MKGQKSRNEHVGTINNHGYSFYPDLSKFFLLAKLIIVEEKKKATTNTPGMGQNNEVYSKLRGRLQNFE